MRKLSFLTPSSIRSRECLLPHSFSLSSSFSSPLYIHDQGDERYEIIYSGELYVGFTPNQIISSVIRERVSCRSSLSSCRCIRDGLILLCHRGTHLDAPFSLSLSLLLPTFLYNYTHTQLKDLEFTHDSAIAELSTKAEKEYADCFTFGHLGLAQKELYAPRSTSWQVFRVGIRLGGVVMLFLWVLWWVKWSRERG